MTREEAITYIKEWLKDECIYCKNREALMIAEEALEERGSEPARWRVGKVSKYDTCILCKKKFVNVNKKAVVVCNECIKIAYSSEDAFIRMSDRIHEELIRRNRQ